MLAGGIPAEGRPITWVQPQLVMSVLGVFLLGYGVSLVARTRATARWRRRPRACPECRREWVAGAERCGACGHETPDATRRKAGVWRFGGVLFVALGVATLIGAMVVHDWWVEEAGFDPGDNDGFEFGPVLGAGFGLSSMGLYVLVMGYRGQRAKGRRRCPKCWYLIDAAVGMKCSECGHEARRERDLFRPKRRWRVAALGVALIAAGQLGWLESRVRRGGWVAAVPTEVLILGMPWLPEAWVLGEESLVSPPTTDFDEDWSLAGRMWSLDEDYWRESHAWAWHKGFTAWRARGLIKPTASPHVMYRALAVKPDPADNWDGEGEPPNWITQDEARTVVEVILNSLDSPDPGAAEACDALLDGVMRSRALRVDSWMHEVVEPRGARIVEIVGDAGHPQRRIAILFARYLADRAGLADALKTAIQDGARGAAGSLVALVDRSPDARAAVLEMLQAPEHAYQVATSIGRLHPKNPDIAAALRLLLASDDPLLQVAGAAPAWRYEEPGGDAERRIVEIIRQQPDLARILIDSLRQFEGAIERHAGVFIEMSRSPNLASREAAGRALNYLFPDEPDGPPTEMQRLAAARLREMAASEPDEGLRELAGWLVEQYDHWNSEPGGGDE